ncbi:haloacid dehalogenase superfamily protein, subfamily IA, variant 3 with third motif having DD or ED [Saccharomonospora azurea SZMC 14600]|nr:haloacid dehalogenase superfamily protein, subfamily IA, variant 3 with third motif having DD or ED [Saccharomonospora azurea SZMC 14600]
MSAGSVAGVDADRFEDRGDDVDEESAVDDVAAVFWDMDGTLVDSEKLWTVALYGAVDWLGGTLTPEQRSALVGANMAVTSRSLLEASGKPADDAAVAEVSDWIRNRIKTLFADAIPWRDGARDALLAVRAAGVPSALVTSTERELTELALRTIGHDMFDVTVCGDEVDGLNKPHPEPYLRAARLLGVDPARCVAVEDSPVGAESAAAAGCTVLVVPHEVPVQPGRRRVFRSSLVGVDVPTLAELARSV